MAEDKWGRLAARYDVTHASIAGDDLVIKVQHELAQMMTGGAVVELGCGTGLYTSAYASLCDSVTATDISPPMVEAARAALAGLPKVTVQLADATATGLPEGSADAVVAVNLLHVVADPAPVLAEARRLLRAGGALIVVDATGRGVPVRRLIGATWRILRNWGPIPPHVKGSRDLHQAALEAVVRDAGFESVVGHTITGHDMNAAVVRATAPRSADSAAAAA